MEEEEEEEMNGARGGEKRPFSWEEYVARSNKILYACDLPFTSRMR
jgi:hypothetical protein